MANSQSAINELNSTINGFTSRVDGKIDSVNESTKKIKNTADKVYARINEFKTNMIENEQKQNAHENIIRIDQMIREQFSSHIKIRKTVMGVVKDFDINLVRNKTIEELSEELWITSSRYWLSYSLIAISAWINDNEKLVGNAVSESYRTDNAKTTLFFCLMNLRFNRLDVAKEWLSEYLETVLPEGIKDEAAILLQAYVNGVFGKDKELEYQVKDIVDGWINDLVHNEEINEDLLKSFDNYIANAQKGAMFKNDFMSAHCKETKAIAVPYLEATKYDGLIELVKKVDVDDIIQNAANYKKRIDAVLLELITNYDSEELELREQQKYFQYIIDNDGKLDNAQKQFDEMLRVKNATDNVGQKFVNWALYDEANTAVRKFGLQNTKSWFMTSLNNWSTSFEDKMPNEYNLEIDGFSCVSNGEDEAIKINELTSYLEQNKFKIKYVNKPNLFLLILFIVGLAGGVFFSISPLNGDGLEYLNIICFAAAVLFLVILGVRILVAGSKFKKKVKKSTDILKGTMTEISSMRHTYEANVEKKIELLSSLEHL